MKKFICILFSMITLISACSSGKQEYKTTIYPSEILTAEDLAPYIGYTPLMNEERSRRESTVTYVNENIGEGEPVEIKIFQKNQLQSEDKVREYFDECRQKRSDSFPIESLGVDSFIAYPSIHYYIEGYHVKITAGTGSDNLQKALLMNLARLSLQKFTELTGIETKVLLNSSDNSK